MAEAFRKGAQQYATRNRCMVLGRGYHYATACELALKLKETCYLQAEAYSSADFLHGPIAMVDRDVLVVAFSLSGRAAHSVREALEQCKRQGERFHHYGLRGLDGVERSLLSLTRIPPRASFPIPAGVAGQLFALGLAESRGIHPDHP